MLKWTSAVATGGRQGDNDKRQHPLTTACAPILVYSEHVFGPSRITTRQQALMEKGIITFILNSRL